MRLPSALATLFILAAPLQAEAQDKAAWFGLHLIDMSLGTTSEAEEARRAATGAQLVATLEESGRYAFVDTSSVAEEMDRYQNLAHCNRCDASMARRLGADVAISAEIQKTSNLILHISVYIRDAETGTLIGGGSADIRGNTDESWRRGMSYILRNRILN